MSECDATAAPTIDQAQLTLERTFLAHERTLMAWNRTAVSLITFGFALYKFFFYLHQTNPPTVGEQIMGPRTYGLCMIGTGVITLVLATLQHRRQLKALRRIYPEAPMSLSLLLAGFMGTLGTIAFVLGVLRS